MKISDYLTEEKIILNLKSSKKKDVINELGRLLSKSNLLADYKKFINEVFKREELCTTGIGNEVALPHARTDSVKKFIIVFGRAVNGIDFDSLDKKPVKLFFLMGTPQSEEIKQYLHILAYLNRLLQKEKFRSELLNAGTASEIIDIFKKNENI